jgi:hypothetical protein
MQTIEEALIKAAAPGGIKKMPQHREICPSPNAANSQVPAVIAWRLRREEYSAAVLAKVR